MKKTSERLLKNLQRAIAHQIILRIPASVRFLGVTSIVPLGLPIKVPSLGHHGGLTGPPALNEFFSKGLVKTEQTRDTKGGYQVGRANKESDGVVLKNLDGLWTGDFLEAF